VFDDVEMILDT